MIFKRENANHESGDNGFVVRICLFSNDLLNAIGGGDRLIALLTPFEDFERVGFAVVDIPDAG